MKTMFPAVTAQSSTSTFLYAGRLSRLLSTLRLCAGRLGPLEGARLLLEYCDLAEADRTPIRMVRGHSFSLIGAPGMVHLVQV